MKKTAYGALGLAAAIQVNTASALDFGNADATLGGSTTSADVAIVTILTTVAQFLYLLAVVYAIYGGFVILTAAGDEEKVKKGRTVIMHAILGLIVIFLARAIIDWVVTLILK